LKIAGKEAPSIAGTVPDWIDFQALTVKVSLNGWT
jgi:hypothetical protein